MEKNLSHPGWKWRTRESLPLCESLGFWFVCFRGISWLLPSPPPDLEVFGEWADEVPSAKIVGIISGEGSDVS